MESHVNFYGTVKLDKDGRISRELPCIGCEYDLRGLMLDQDCPECGEPVRSSIERREDRRWNYLPVYIAGVSLILFAIAAFFRYLFVQSYEMTTWYAAVTAFCGLVMLVACIVSFIVLCRVRTLQALFSFLVTLALLGCLLPCFGNA